MIVDCHTHLGWYPDHYSEAFVDECLAAKRAKMRMSKDVYFRGDDKHGGDATLETHLTASADADKTVVVAFAAPYSGFQVPNELVAGYVKAHPDRFIGYASVDPSDPAAAEQLEYCVRELGLRGLKLGPIYQNFDPGGKQAFAVYHKAAELCIPILWHQGTTFVRKGRLKWADPILLDEVAISFPELKMIIAHLGHPWEMETIVLIRKQPNVFADISALHYRPWRYYNAMIGAIEYGVEHKLLLGSDFPSATIKQVISGLYKVNDVIGDAPLPQVPREVMENIIYENWKAFFDFA
jgi:predicted TIM-barrel fold metal-dependent hydrolase